MTRRPENILISVEHAHVLNILGGRKTAELRRRPLRIEAGTRIWIYSKLPRGHVELVATAEEVVAASPRKLWDLYGTRFAITYSEFKKYLNGVEVGCAILLGGVTRLNPALDLASMRRATKQFHPPQFFKRLIAQGPELTSFLSSKLIQSESNSAW